MTGFNLSEWALRHRSFTWYLILSLTLAGGLAYIELGREEDPDFTIKTMVVQTNWPGATIEDTINLVTDPIEKKLEEVPYLDYVKSYTKPGFSVVYVNLKDYTPPEVIPDLWYQVRKKIADIKHTLPQGVQGPFFNDEFGDTFGTVYAFTADGFSYRELKDFAEIARAELMRVPNVGKIQFVGIQDEKIYLDFSTRQLAGTGHRPRPGHRRPPGPERGGPGRRGPGRRREGHGPGQRRIHLRGEPGGDQPARQRQVLPAGRRGARSGAATPIRRRRSSATTASPPSACSSRWRPAATCWSSARASRERMRQIEADLPIGIETHLVANQPWSSRRRSPASPRRWRRPWSSSWRSASSA